jgi:oligoendopeptidase F
MTKKARRFVPVDFDPANPDDIDPAAKKLLEEDISSPSELENWLLDCSEFISVMDEYANLKYIDKTCHTDDEAIQKAFLHYVEEIEPRMKPIEFALKKKFIASPHRQGLTGNRYAMLTRNWQAEVELFREENIPLETEITKIVNEYDKICAQQMVEFRGKSYTMPQMAKFAEEPDRVLREEAWFASNDRRLKDREAIDGIFDQLLPLREKIATNAGLKNYREYCWKAMRRFDYTPEDCLRFADSVEKHVVPIKLELARQRALALGLAKLRPWDLAVDVKNRAPLRPFAEDQIDLWVDKTKKIFDRLSPILGEQFDTLRQNGNLDLASRKGKAPGGYQSFLPESLQPFIFMNAAGTNRDITVLLHEGGHAFHSLHSKDEPLHFLRHAPMEFCEVASMAMELLAEDHLNEFYSPEEHARAKRAHLEGVVQVLTWIAIIDSFQHWIYTNPGHTRQQRQDKWLEIFNRFEGSVTDRSGLEAHYQAFWHRQLHLFHMPFYYIEYGIAQLGALQLWMKSKEDPRTALNNYRNGLKLGGTKPLPQLFSAAGITFDFSQKTIEPLMNTVREELAELPV